jgi:hypothetical protein
MSREHDEICNVVRSRLQSMLPEPPSGKPPYRWRWAKWWRDVDPELHPGKVVENQQLNQGCKLINWHYIAMQPGALPGETKS